MDIGSIGQGKMQQYLLPFHTCYLGWSCVHPVEGSQSLIIPRIRPPQTRQKNSAGLSCICCVRLVSALRDIISLFPPTGGCRDFSQDGKLSSYTHAFASVAARHLSCQTFDIFSGRTNLTVDNHVERTVPDGPTVCSICQSYGSAVTTICWILMWDPLFPLHASSKQLKRHGEVSSERAVKR